MPKEIAKAGNSNYDLSFLLSFAICLHFKGLQGVYLCYLCHVILNGNLRDYTKLT